VTDVFPEDRPRSASRRALDRIEEEDERARARANLFAPDAPTPDQVARDRADALTIGAAPSMPADSLTRAAAEAARNQEPLETSPRLRAWLANPANAAVARDDVHALSFWERLGQSVLNPGGSLANFVGGGVVATVRSGGSNLTRGWTQGVLGNEQSQLNARDMRAGRSRNGGEPLPALTAEERARSDELATRDGQDWNLGDPFGNTARVLPQIIGAFQHAGTTAGEGASAAWEAVYGDERAQLETARRIMSGDPIARITQAGQTLFAVPFAAAVGTLSGVAGYLEYNFDQNAGPAFDASMREGYSREAAANRAEQYGAVATGIEVVLDAVGFKLGGMATLVGRVPEMIAGRALTRATIPTIARDFAVRTAAMALDEGGEEALQSIAESLFSEAAALDTAAGRDLGAGGVADAAISIAASRRKVEDMLEAAFTSFIIGAQVGGVTGGVVNSFNLGFDLRDLRRASTTAQMFRDINAGATSSVLRTRAPGTYADAVTAMTQRGPLDTMTFDAEGFSGFFQERNIDPYKAAEELGVSRVELESALNSGGSIDVSTGAFAAKIAGGAHQDLAQHARMGPGDMTRAEIEARAVLGVDLARAATEATRYQTEYAQARAKTDALETRAEEIYADTGFIPQVNRNLAALTIKRARMMADGIEGGDALEQLNRMGLTVQGPLHSMAGGGGFEQRALISSLLRSQQGDAIVGSTYGANPLGIKPDSGADTPIVIAMTPDGPYVVDGYHRLNLAEARGQKDIAVRVIPAGEAGLQNTYDVDRDKGWLTRPTTEWTEGEFNQDPTPAVNSTAAKFDATVEEIAAALAAVARRAPMAELFGEGLMARVREYADKTGLLLSAEQIADADFMKNRAYADPVTHEVIDFEEAAARIAVEATKAAGGAANIKYDRQAFFIMAISAAGKSDTVNALAAEWGAVHSDIDSAKQWVPDFLGGYNSSAVSNEAALLMMHARESHMSNGANVMIEMIGDSDHVALAKEYAEQGYEISIVHLDVEGDVGAGRMIGRFLAPDDKGGGRYISPTKYVQRAPLAHASFRAGIDKFPWNGYVELDVNGPRSEVFSVLVGGRQGDNLRAAILNGTRRWATDERGAGDNSLSDIDRPGSESGAPSELGSGKPGLHQEGLAGPGGSAIITRDARGVMTSALVKLFQGRDLSTPIHEIGGHVFLETIRMVAEDAKAKPRAKELWADTLAWFGLTAEQWATMSQLPANEATDALRPYHELFARTFEVYTATGKAPSASLRDVLAQFRQWMIAVYTSLVNLHSRIGGDELTPEIRSVFDRMLATDAEIDAVTHEQGGDIAFPREWFGKGKVADAQYERYKKDIVRSREDAQRELDEKSIGAVLAEHNAFRRARESKVRRTVEIEVDQQPVRLADKWLRWGQWTGPVPAGLEPIKLAPATIVEDYDGDVLAALPKGVLLDTAGLLDQARATRAALREAAPVRLSDFVQSLGGMPPSVALEGLAEAAAARPGLIDETAPAPLEGSGGIIEQAWGAGYFGNPPGFNQDSNRPITGTSNEQDAQIPAAAGPAAPGNRAVSRTSDPEHYERLWNFTRGSGRAGEGFRLSLKPLGVHAIADITRDGEPNFIEIDATHPASVDKFRALMLASKEGHKFGSSVFVYSAEEYATMRLFLAEDGKTGGALKPNGDMVSGFSTNSGGSNVIQILIAAGGTMGDAFDTVLPRLYAANGFRAVARVPWNDEFAPDGWDYNTFARFNAGRPDVVYMVYDPGPIVDYAAGQGETFANPDDAVAAQAKALKEIAQRERVGNGDARTALGDGSQAGAVQDGRGISGSKDELAAHGRADLADDATPLQGAPQKVKIPGLGSIPIGPWPQARAAARAYMASIKRAYAPPTIYQKIDVERATEIGVAYADMKHAPRDPAVVAAYAALTKETLAQYQFVKASGLVAEFIDYAKQGNPYAASPRLSTEDVRNNNHMWVFSTDDGFGQVGITESDLAENPLLAMTDELISGRPARVNDIFRIVHDYFGHVTDGVGFRAEGEDAAWRSHAAMFSAEALPAMTSETRGQNSWLNYGPHGATNRVASSEDTKFAEQKIGMIPAWVLHAGRLDEGQRAAEANRLANLTPSSFGAVRKMSDEDVLAWYRLHVVEGRTRDGAIALRFRSEERLTNPNVSLVLDESTDGSFTAVTIYRGRTDREGSRDRPSRKQIAAALRIFTRVFVVTRAWILINKPTAVEFAGSTAAHEKVYHAALSTMSISGYENHETTERNAVAYKGTEISTPTRTAESRAETVHFGTHFVFIRDDIAATLALGVGPLEISAPPYANHPGALRKRQETRTLLRNGDESASPAQHPAGPGPTDTGGNGAGGAGVGGPQQRRGGSFFAGTPPTLQEFLERLAADLAGTPAYRLQDDDAVAARQAAEQSREWFADRGVDINAKPAALKLQIARLAARDDIQAVDADTAASVLNGALGRTAFASGAELLEALSNLQPRREAIDAEVKQRMLEEFGDPLADGSLTDEARIATHNSRAQVIELELAAMSRAVGAAQRPVQRLAKDIAARQIKHMMVRQIHKYDTFLAAERRHAKAAADLYARGEHAAAITAKHNQLVNFYLYRLAREASAQMDVAQRYFKKFDSPGVRANIDNDYLDQIDQLLEGYELRKISNRAIQNRINLAAWVKQMEDAGQGHRVAVDPAVLKRANKTPFAHLGLDEVKGLLDTIKNIEHLGRTKDKLLDALDQREFRARIGDLTAAMNATGPISAQLRANYSPNALERTQDRMREVHAEMTRMEFLFRYLDGAFNGPLWRALWAPFARAADKESLMMHRSAVEMSAVWDRYTSSERRRMFKTRIPMHDLPVGAARNYNKSELLAIALNLGNEGNLKALVDGFDWGKQMAARNVDIDYEGTKKQIIASLSRVLDAKDWETVTMIWKLVASFRDEAFQLQEDLTGVRPEAVEATPLTTPFGELEGGYYPLKFDRKRDKRVARAEEKQTVQEMWGSNWSAPMTRKGHTINRVGSGGRPVKLALGVMTEHIQNVVHDIAYRRAVVDVDRIITDSQFAEAFTDVAGLPMYEQLRPWLQAIASDRVDPSAWMWKVFQKMRGNVAIAAMGYRISTGLQQLAGLVQAIPMLGAGEMGGALVKLVGNPRNIPAKAQFILTRSEFMRTRTQTLDRDIREQQERMERDDPLYPIQNNAFALVGMFDWAVSSVVWTAAYDKARAGNVDGIDPTNEADAVMFADSAVRTTQSAGLSQDLPQIMRGPQMNKLLTMFFSYFSVLYNWTAFDQIMNVKKGRLPVHVFIANMALIYIISPLIAEALAGRLGNRDDESDEERNARIMSVLLRFPFQSIPILRDVANAAGTGFDYAMSPVSSAPGQIINAGRDLIQGRAFRSEAATKRVFTAVGYAFGLPTPAAWIPIDYIADKLEGEEEEGFDVMEALVRDSR